MKIGLQLPWFTFPGGAASHRDQLIRIAQEADSLGLNSLWVMDHFFMIDFDSPPFPVANQFDDPMHEAMTLLGFLAGVTDRIQLGPLVCCATARPAGVLVKAITSLDVLSGGRAYMGIGAGWFREEAVGLGIPFPDISERYRVLEDTIRLARHCWEDDSRPFVGHTFTAPNPLCRPAPLRGPHPPILIGGDGERKTLRLVASLADACNFFFGHNQANYSKYIDAMGHKLEVLRSHCRDLGRDVAEIEVTALGITDLDKMNDRELEELVQALRAVGVQHTIFDVPHLHRGGYIERLAALRQR